MTARSSGFISSLKSPLSWAAAGIVLGLEWLFWMWFHPPAGMVLVAITPGVVLLGSWIAWLSGVVLLAQRRIDQARDEQKLRRLQSDQLAADLQDSGADKGVRQIDLLLQKFETLTDVLARRLNSGELTCVRYLDAAEQVLLSTLDNLEEISITLRSTGEIDQDAPENVPGETDVHTSAGESGPPAGWPSTRIEVLYSQNEEAMATLDRAAAVLDSRLPGGKSAIDRKSALHGLDQVAVRMRRHSPSKGP